MQQRREWYPWHSETTAGGRTRGRWIDDVAAVHLVHPPEVIHVGQEHGGTGDVFEPEPGCLQQRRQIAHDLVGLRADLARHEVAGGRV